MQRREGVRDEDEGSCPLLSTSGLSLTACHAPRVRAASDAMQAFDEEEDDLVFDELMVRVHDPLPASRGSAHAAALDPLPDGKSTIFTLYRKKRLLRDEDSGRDAPG
jgi:hypothetical protein